MPRRNQLKTERIEFRTRPSDMSKFLPASDTNWTVFATLTSREKDGPIAQCSVITDALNAFKDRNNNLFEYRFRPSAKPVAK